MFAVEKLSNRRMTIDKCCAAAMWSWTSSSADVAAENNIKEKMNYWASRFGHSLTQHLPVRFMGLAHINNPNKSQKPISDKRRYTIY